jgi:molecular chaperone DnaK
MNEIKAALEELNASFQAAGQAVYAAQSAPTADATGGEPTDEPKKDDVAEADFEIVDEKKDEKPS